MKVVVIFLTILFWFNHSLGQDNKTLDSLLSKTLPQSSTSDGRWVYFREIGDIHRIEAPEISNVFPFYKFIALTLPIF